MSKIDLCSVSQWAKRYGVSRRFVLQEIADGRLIARKFGNQYLIDPGENSVWIGNPKRGSRGNK